MKHWVVQSCETLGGPVARNTGWSSLVRQWVVRLYETLGGPVMLHTGWSVCAYTVWSLYDTHAVSLKVAIHRVVMSGDTPVSCDILVGPILRYTRAVQSSDTLGSPFVLYHWVVQSTIQVVSYVASSMFELFMSS